MIKLNIKDSINPLKENILNTIKDKYLGEKGTNREML